MLSKRIITTERQEKNSLPEDAALCGALGCGRKCALRLYDCWSS
jgi:hypothetical protein